MKRILTESISEEQITSLRARGYKAVDLHVHTDNSYDVPENDDLSAKALFAKAKDAGMDFVTFTDHDDMRAHIKHFGEGHVPGVELTVNDPFIGYEIHINIYTLNEDQFFWLQEHNNDIKAVLAYCNTHDLPHTYNHPFAFEPKDYKHVLRHPRSTIRSIKWLAEHIDVLEINHSRPKILTRLVYPLAKHYDNALITSTDTHTGEVATAYTLAQGATFQEWFSNVKAGEAVLVHRTTTDSYFDTEAYKYMHNLLQVREKTVGLRTDNAAADAIIRLTNKYKRLARLLSPIIRPIVGLVTRSGIARLWYARTQKAFAKLLGRYIDAMQAQRIKRHRKPQRT